MQWQYMMSRDFYKLYMPRRKYRSIDLLHKLRLNAFYIHLHLQGYRGHVNSQYLLLTHN
jgi:hypothetical protein